jgi:ABC-type Fe3+-hydroxamate transport system substrate-binding protein
MVDLSMGSEAAPFPPRPLERWGRYGTVPAVVSGRVHRISGSAWLRPGPRTAQAAAELAELLHPETSP